MKNKDKIFGILFIIAIAVAAAWNFSQNQDEVTLSDLALENVEALAAGEGGVTITGCCASSYVCVFTLGTSQIVFTNASPCSV